MELVPLAEPPARPAARSMQLVLVRANGPLFYSLAAASLFEVGMPLAADRMLHFFAADAPFERWLRTEWLPQKQLRARQLREYIEAAWPEYDWTGGLEHYRWMIDACGPAPAQQPTAAHEALARCVVSAQSSVFYRSVARWADDSRLRALSRQMAHEDATAFLRFRELYERRLRVQGLGCTSAWTTALACVRSARDYLVPRAFGAVNAQCAAHVPFPTLEYPEFISRMSAVIERHGDLRMPERVLLRTWRRSPRLPLQEAQRRFPTTFRPVLKSS